MVKRVEAVEGNTLSKRTVPGSAREAGERGRARSVRQQRAHDGDLARLGGAVQHRLARRRARVEAGARLDEQRHHLKTRAAVRVGSVGHQICVKVHTTNRLIWARVKSWESGISGALKWFSEGRINSVNASFGYSEKTKGLSKPVQIRVEVQVVSPTNHDITHTPAHADPRSFFCSLFFLAQFTRWVRTQFFKSTQVFVCHFSWILSQTFHRVWLSGSLGKQWEPWLPPKEQNTPRDKRQFQG